MKYLMILMSLTIVGCHEPEIGHCYANESYSDMLRVTQVLEYGAFYKVVRFNNKLVDVKIYISFEKDYQKLEILHQIDCQVVDEFEK